MTIEITTNNIFDISTWESKKLMVKTGGLERVF